MPEERRFSVPVYYFKANKLNCMLTTMPKRSNPFGDNSRCQLKTHIREKEVNNGVCQQTRMQSVYDRTHQLLFSGMKEMKDKHVSLDTNENFMVQIGETTKADMKQMHIGKNCQLVNCDENSLMVMETDSNSCDGPLTHSVSNSLDISSSVAKASATDGADCCSEILPLFGPSFGRSHIECSPPSTTSHPRPPSNIASNAFSYMKQAQLKKTVSKESLISHGSCHNCRQSPHLQNVMKCQFCENCVCCTCMRQCGNCLLHFCQLCSVINYDLPAERSFCLNCHGR